MVGVCFVVSSVKAQKSRRTFVADTELVVYQSWPTIHSCESNLVSSSCLVSSCPAVLSGSLSDTLPFCRYDDNYGNIHEEFGFWKSEFRHSMEPSDQVESLGIDYRRGNYKIDRQFNSLKLISFISSWSKTGKCDQETSFRPWRLKNRMTKYRSFAARLACLKSYSCLQEDIEYVQIVVLSEPHILGWSDFAFIHDKIHNEDSRWMDIPTYCCLSRSQNRKISSVGQCQMYQLSQVCWVQNLPL